MATPSEIPIDDSEMSEAGSSTEPTPVVPSYPLRVDNVTVGLVWGRCVSESMDANKIPQTEYNINQYGGALASGTQYQYCKDVSNKEARKERLMENNPEGTSTEITIERPTQEARGRYLSVRDKGLVDPETGLTHKVKEHVVVEDHDDPEILVKPFISGTPSVPKGVVYYKVEPFILTSEIFKAFISSLKKKLIEISEHLHQNPSWQKKGLSEKRKAELKGKNTIDKCKQEIMGKLTGFLRNLRAAKDIAKQQTTPRSGRSGNTTAQVMQNITTGRRPKTSGGGSRRSFMNKPGQLVTQLRNALRNGGGKLKGAIDFVVQTLGRSKKRLRSERNAILNHLIAKANAIKSSEDIDSFAQDLTNTVTYLRTHTVETRLRIRLTPCQAVILSKTPAIFARSDRGYVYISDLVSFYLSAMEKILISYRTGMTTRDLTREIFCQFASERVSPDVLNFILDDNCASGMYTRGNSTYDSRNRFTAREIGEVHANRTVSKGNFGVYRFANAQFERENELLQANQTGCSFFGLDGNYINPSLLTAEKKSATALIKNSESTVSLKTRWVEVVGDKLIPLKNVPVLRGVARDLLGGASQVSLKLSDNGTIRIGEHSVEPGAYLAICKVDRKEMQKTQLGSFLVSPRVFPECVGSINGLPTARIKFAGEPVY